MVISVGLTLLLGVSLGLVAGRLIFASAKASASGPRGDRPVWFVCSAPEDVENEPGYLYPERLRLALLDGLSRDLDLSDEQRLQLDLMLEEKREGARRFWEELRESYCATRDGFRADIRSLLQPDQQVLFDRIMADADEAAQRRSRDPSKGAEPAAGGKRSE